MIRSIFPVGASIGLSGLGYSLPPLARTLDQLEDEGRLVSKAGLLREYGFENCLVHDGRDAGTDLMMRSAEVAIASSNRSAEGIGRVFLCSGVHGGSQPFGSDVLNLFRYPVAELQHRLNLSQANALALSQQGCSGLLSAIDLAGALLAGAEAGGVESILCIAGDSLPAESKREILYNVISDATAAVVVSRNCDTNRILCFCQQVQSYYWDTPLHENELLASYFPIAARVIAAALESAGLRMDDLRWIVPHNVSLRSWEILAKLLGIPIGKVWTRNIARVGHTISCDHVINLVDMEHDGALEKNDPLLLFTFGFGATWTALVLRH
jgi:3-oxoacyl-[acyl-carrier-protein] synthase-3